MWEVGSFCLALNSNPLAGSSLLIACIAFLRSGWHHLLLLLPSTGKACKNPFHVPENQYPGLYMAVVKTQHHLPLPTQTTTSTRHPGGDLRALGAPVYQTNGRCSFGHGWTQPLFLQLLGSSLQWALV